MTVFFPENAVLVAVNSAFPRLVRGRFGNLGEEALMVAQYLVVGLRGAVKFVRAY
jgi:hypothetical protein